MEQATKGASDKTKQMIKNANGNTIALNQMTFGAKAASAAMSLLSTVMNMAIMWGISKLITAWDDYKEKLREVSEETAKIANESLSSADSLLELRGQLKDDTVSAEDLTSAFREQMRTMGYTETQIDSLIQKYGGLSGAIDEVTRKALENAKTEAFAAKTSSAKELETLYDGTNFWVHGKDSVFSVDKDILTGYEDLDKEIKSILENVAEYSEINVGYRAKGDSAEEIYAYYQGILEINQLINDYAEKETDKKLQNLDHGSLLSEVNEIINGLSEAANRYGDAIGIIHKSDAQLELADYLKENNIDSKESFNNYVNGIKDSEHYSEEYKNVLLEVANDAFPQFSAAAKDASDSLSDFPDEITVSNIFKLEDAKGELTLLGDLNKQVDDLQAAYTSLKSAMDSYNESGHFTLDQVQEIISYGDSYLQYLMDENGNLQLNEDALNRLMVARINEMRVKALSDLYNQVSSIKDEADALKFLEGRLTDVTEATNEYNEAKFQSLLLAKRDLMSDEAYAKFESSVIKMVKTTNALFDNISIDRFSGKVDKETDKAAEAAKENLESTLTLYKAELDSGIIDLKTYLNKCNALLDDARDKAIITGKEYWDYQKEILENQKSIYDKVLNAVVRRYDKEIDSIEETIESLEKQNEALDKQFEKYDSALSAISTYLDKQKDLVQDNIDGIEAENDAIDKEIDGYDQLLSAVTLVIDAKRESIESEKEAIDDRIKALQEENDENQKALEFEKAKYELERLHSQRNKKLYVGGKGYIYDYDHNAIRDAEENVANLELNATVDALEKEKELLDEILEQLDDTEQKWQDISSAFENNKALDKAFELLGDNFKNIILEGDDKSINDILNAYIGAQGKLEENTLIIEDYEKRMDQLD